MAKKRKSAAPDADPAVASVETTTPAMRAKQCALVLAILEPLSIAGLFIFLLAKTWMRWPDPLIDFPRELYTAWRMSVGDLLYVNVMSWYGPLPHLVEAEAFKLFGVGLDTIVWLNVGLLVAGLLLLRAIFKELGGRLVAWLCSVVFLAIFAFGHFVLIGNYNFITPYASQATYGFLGLLLTLWGLLRHARAEKRRWLAVAGLGLAVTYLDKPEVLLAAAGSLVVYCAVKWLRRWRAGDAGRWRVATMRFLRDTGWVFAGFFALYVPVFLILAMQGGVGYSARYTNWVPYTAIAPEFRNTALTSTFNAATIGTDDPHKNFMIQLHASGMLLLVCGIVIAAAWLWARSKKFGVVSWISLVAASGVVAYILGQTWSAFHPADPVKPDPTWEVAWIDIGRAIVFPTFLATLAVIGGSLWSAWKGRTDFSRMLNLAVVGTAGSLMLARMVLNGRILHYGFFMAPLAVLFLIALVAGEIPRLSAGKWSANWLMKAAFALLVLCGATAAGSVSLSTYVNKTYAVGEGRDRFYSFDPHTGFFSGWLLNQMIEGVKANAPNARTLVAFPESAAVNYHLRLRDPVPELEFLPTTMVFVGRDRVLKDLQENPPDAAILYMRDLREYGVPCFGSNENSDIAILSGFDIIQWLGQNYHLVQSLAGPTPMTYTHDVFDILVHVSSPSTPSPSPTPPAAQLPPVAH